MTGIPSGSSPSRCWPVIGCATTGCPARSPPGCHDLGSATARQGPPGESEVPTRTPEMWLAHEPWPLHSLQDGDCVHERRGWRLMTKVVAGITTSVDGYV